MGFVCLEHDRAMCVDECESDSANRVGLGAY